MIVVITDYWGCGSRCCIMCIHILSLSCLLLSTGVDAIAVVDEDQTVSISVEDGCNVSLICDLINVPDGYGIFWYHDIHRVYLSYNDVETFGPNSPQHYYVSCMWIDEKCILTIFNVQLRDEGRYVCGIYDATTDPPSQAKSVAYTTLTVIQRTAPNEKSPECVISVEGNPGDQATGHTVHMRCIVNGGIPKPTIIWYIGNSRQMGPYTESTTIDVLLTADDIGEQFTCVMTHPLLEDSRNCSLTPLPLRSTSSTTFGHFSRSSTKNITSPFQQTASPKPNTELSTTTTAVVSVICILVIIIIAAGMFLIILRKRNGHRSNSNKLDNELNTMNRKNENTHIPLLGKDQELQQMSTTLKQHPAQCQTSSDNTNIDYAFPVYATPSKTNGNNSTLNVEGDTNQQYANLPRHSGSNSPEDTRQMGLMYAALDLSGSSDSKITSAANQEVTVYADIQ